MGKPGSGVKGLVGLGWVRPGLGLGGEESKMSRSQARVTVDGVDS